MLIWLEVAEISFQHVGWTNLKSSLTGIAIFWFHLYWCKNANYEDILKWIPKIWHATNSEILNNKRNPVSSVNKAATQTENQVHMGLKKLAFTDVMTQEFSSNKSSGRQMVVTWKYDLPDDPSRGLLFNQMCILQNKWIHSPNSPWGPCTKTWQW